MGCGASMKQEPEGLGGQPPSMHDVPIKASGGAADEPASPERPGTKSGNGLQQSPAPGPKPDSNEATPHPLYDPSALVGKNSHPIKVPPQAEPPPDPATSQSSAGHSVHHSVRRGPSNPGLPHAYEPPPPPAEVAAAATPDVALECAHLGHAAPTAANKPAKRGPTFRDAIEGDTPIPPNGVSLAALLAFRDRHLAWLSSPSAPSTAAVVQALVRPVVAASGLSAPFVDLLASKDPSASGRPTAFVSHAWSTPFLSLVEALHLHLSSAAALASARGGGGAAAAATTAAFDPAAHFLWVDAFCWNQADLRSASRAWWMGSLAPHIAACGRTVTVLSPWDRPAALSRAWCLFEMAATLVSPRAHLSLALTAADERSLLDALSQPGFGARAAALFRAVDLRSARSEVPEDALGIRAAVAEALGAAALNSAVAERLRAWLADHASRALASLPPADAAGRPRGCSALISNLALLLRELGKAGRAADLLREAVDARREHLGAAHEETLAAATDLASALQADEKLEEARQLYEHVLEHRRAAAEAAAAKGVGAAGAEGAAEGLFRALEGLAGTLQEEGRLEEAGRAFAEAAEAVPRLLGADHPTAIAAELARTAFGMHKLGHLLEADARITTLLDRMNAHPELGEKHPTTLLAHAVAADAALLMGRYTEAWASARACADGRAEVFGAHHSDTAEAALVVAASLLQLGRLKEADDAATSAVEEVMGTLGAIHPRVTDAEVLLARVVAERGRRRVAVEALRRCLAKHRNAFTLTAVHPKVLSAADALADAFLQLGKPESAEELVAEVEAGRRKLLPADHPDVLAAAVRRAQLLTALGRPVEALRALREEVVPQSERALGAGHPETLRAVHCAAEAALALADEDAGMAAEAVPLVERAVEGRTQALGEWHFETLRSVRLKALLASRDKSREEHGVNTEALRLFEHVARGRLRCLGRRHPDTRLSLSEYAQHASQPERLTAASRLMASEAAAMKAAAGVDDSDEVWEMEDALAFASAGPSAGGKKATIVPGHEDVDGATLTAERRALSRMASLPPDDTSFMRPKPSLKPSSIEVPAETIEEGGDSGGGGQRKLQWTQSFLGRERRQMEKAQEEAAAARRAREEDEDDDDGGYAPAKLLARPGKTGPKRRPMPVIDSDEEDEPVPAAAKARPGKTGPRRIGPGAAAAEEDDDEDDEEEEDEPVPVIKARPGKTGPRRLGPVASMDEDDEEEEEEEEGANSEPQSTGNAKKQLAQGGDGGGGGGPPADDVVVVAVTGGEDKK